MLPNYANKLDQQKLVNEFRILSRSVPEKDCLLGAALQWDLRKKTEAKRL